MKTYIAMLRGINVSGQKKVPMAELREVLSNIGLHHMETYIQSGNLVFESDVPGDEIAADIKESIFNHFGFEVPTLVLPASELDSIISGNPFHQHDLSKLHVTFLADTPDPQLSETLTPPLTPREAFRIDKKVIYVYCPDGYGRTKINNTFFEKKLKTTATTRNWKTCQKLWQMANQHRI